MCVSAYRSERERKKLNAAHNELPCIKGIKDLWAIITETLAYFHQPLTVRQRTQDRFNRQSLQLAFTALLCPLAVFLLFNLQLNLIKAIIYLPTTSVSHAEFGTEHIQKEQILLCTHLKCVKTHIKMKCCPFCNASSLACT